ncbi:MAG: PAS domain-containing protein [Bacteroidetes bacterium]|nr:PAS domain-containing protein [Bacteroidota bacterium]
MSANVRENVFDGEMLLNANIDGIMVLDENAGIVFWNKTAEKNTGISHDSIRGKKLQNVFPEFYADEELRNAISMVFNGYKTFVPARIGIPGRDHYESHFIPLQNAAGEARGVMLIMHDISNGLK